VRAPFRLRGLPLFGFALSGLLLGHAISYAVAVPDPHHRDLVLERAGHGYLPAAGDAALIVALAGVAAVVVRAWSTRGRAEPDTFGSIARLLALVQVGAFVGQEVLERMVAGAPLGDLASEHVLSIGAVTQVAVALAGAVVLRSLARASARLIRSVTAVRRTPARRAAAAAIAPSTPDPLHGRLLVSAASVRAPPSA
jgi:hypothetical protein